MNAILFCGALLAGADPAPTAEPLSLVQSLGLTRDEVLYISSCEMERKSHIDKIKDQLRQPQSGSNKLGTRAQRIKVLRSELKDWETRSTFYPYEIRAISLAMPLCGEFSNAVKIVQIVSNDEALIKTDVGESAWLSGFDMTKHVDGQSILLRECVIVDSTKKYTTVLGATKTIFVVHKPSLDSGHIAAMLKALNENDQAAAANAVTKSQRIKSRHMERDIAPQSPEEGARKKYGPLLSNAKSLIKPGIVAGAEKNLRRIIAEAPGTKIAAEAQQVLESMPGTP